MSNFIKKMTISTITLATALPLSVYSATFATPKYYSIIIFDGAKTSSFFGSTNKVELEPGQHQIVVNFKGSFKNGRDAILTSAVDPIVINLPNVKKDDKFTFKIPRITNYSEANDFADNQKITIYNKGNKVTEDEASYFILKSEKSFQLDRDYYKDLSDLGLLYISKSNQKTIAEENDTLQKCKESNFKNCPKEITASSTNTNNANIPVMQTKNTEIKYNKNKVNESTLSGLKAIYNGADENTKKAFKDWLQKN